MMNPRMGDRAKDVKGRERQRFSAFLDGHLAGLAGCGAGLLVAVGDRTGEPGGCGRALPPWRGPAAPGAAVGHGGGDAGGSGARRGARGHGPPSRRARRDGAQPAGPARPARLGRPHGMPGEAVPLGVRPGRAPPARLASQQTRVNIRPLKTTPLNMRLEIKGSIFAEHAALQPWPVRSRHPHPAGRYTPPAPGYQGRQGMAGNADGPTYGALAPRVDDRRCGFLSGQYPGFCRGPSAPRAGGPQLDDLSPSHDSFAPPAPG
jgi:hypothetical protein